MAGCGNGIAANGNIGLVGARGIPKGRGYGNGIRGLGIMGG